MTKSTRLTLNTTLSLSTGHKIPTLGFGVYKTPPSQCTSVTLHALSTGYRHIDSARAYNNEGPVADAIRSSGIPRSSIFFTTKVPPGHGSMGYEVTKKQIASSFAKTKLDYIDLYLVHAPFGTAEERKGTWRALVEAQQEGKVRSLGVCNYGVHHLNELEGYIKELEAQHGKGKGGSIEIGQWELHPWLTRPDIVDWCRKRDVVIEAYCPLVRGKRADEKMLQELAKKHGKTWAQVLIRWSLQMGFVPLPKSVTPSRIESNADVFDFELSEDDMATLTTEEYSPCAWDPTTANDKTPCNSAMVYDD